LTPALKSVSSGTFLITVDKISGPLAATLSNNMADKPGIRKVVSWLAVTVKFGTVRIASSTTASISIVNVLWQQ